MIYQQGDVLLKSVDSIPNGKKVGRKPRGFVLVEGETTGHAHVIDSDIDLILSNVGEMFLSAKDSVTVVHEEHKPITIPPGSYKVEIVKEYDHFAEEARNVQD